MKPKNNILPLNKRYLVLIIIGMIITFTIGVYLYYQNEKNEVLTNEQSELKSIAELKIKQISDWYSDEINDAKIISQNPDFINHLQIVLNNPKESGIKNLEGMLYQIKLQHDYEDIILKKREGKIFASTNNNINNLDSIILSKCRIVEKTNSTTTSGLYRSSISNKIQLAIISQIDDSKKIPIASIIYLLDTEKFLYPLIQFWPVTGKTSETLIVRKEGENILFLNELKFKKNSALEFKLNKSNENLPAAKAVNGYKGIFEGKDYRGVEVLSYVSPIENTPWFMVAKVDKSELFENLHTSLVLMLIFSVLFILIIIIWISFYYNYRQKNIYKELYKKQKELSRTQGQLETTLKSLGEGVITADINGKIQFINRRAEELTGWNINDAFGKDLKEVYVIKSEKTGKIENEIIQKILKYGLVKELANHTLLVSKSGKEIPLMDTGAPVYDGDGAIAGLVITFQDETEKRNSQRLLEQSEKRNRTTLDNMMEGCQIIGFDWRYIYLNKAAEKQSKKSNAELIGNKYTEVWPGIEKSEVYRMLKKCMDERVEQIFEYLFKFPDGSKSWFEIKVQPVPDGIFILTYDISERKQTLEKYKILSQVVIQSPIGVIITDPKGVIEYANPKFYKVTGFKEDEVIGFTPNILKSGKHSKHFYKNIWETILSGKEWKGEIQNKRKNGELFWEYVLISPIIDEKGKITNFVGVREDITERKKLFNDLVIAKEKAEELNKVKSHFFANMSHELRTPFVGIMGYSELLLETLTDPETKEMAQGILNTSQRMRDTLTKILSITKLEFNAIEPIPRNVDVKDIIDTAYQQFAAAALQKKLKFTKKLEFDNLIVNSDETLLLEILNNLIGNAIIYTESGEIEISAKKLTKDDKDLLTLKVRDTGIGIPKDKQAIIWEDFRQASEGTTRSYQGTGLGLSIVKKYTRLLGGKIYLESEKNKGSIFTVELEIN